MKTYKIFCGDWTDRIDVDEEIFNTEISQCVEAMTLSLENFCEIKGWLDFKLDDYCIVEWVEDKNSLNFGKRYVVSVEYLLENAGRSKDFENIKNDYLQE